MIDNKIKPQRDKSIKEPSQNTQIKPEPSENTGNSTTELNIAKSYPEILHNATQLIEQTDKKPEHNNLYLVQSLPKYVDNIDLIPNLQMMFNEPPSHCTYQDKINLKKNRKKIITPKNDDNPNISMSKLNLLHQTVENQPTITTQVSSKLDSHADNQAQHSIFIASDSEPDQNNNQVQTRTQQSIITTRNGYIIHKPTTKWKYHILPNILYCIILLITEQFLLTILRITNSQPHVIPLEGACKAVDRPHTKLCYYDSVSKNINQRPIYLTSSTTKMKNKNEYIEDTPNQNHGITNYLKSTKFHDTITSVQKTLKQVLPYLKHNI